MKKEVQHDEVYSLQTSFQFQNNKSLTAVPSLPTVSAKVWSAGRPAVV